MKDQIFGTCDENQKVTTDNGMIGFTDGFGFVFFPCGKVVLQMYTNDENNDNFRLLFDELHFIEESENAEEIAKEMAGLKQKDFPN